MEENFLNIILSEFKKSNNELKELIINIQNKFDIIDARFNTLEEIVLTVQNDIGILQNDIGALKSRMTIFEDRMTTFENTITSFKDDMTTFKDKLISIEKITLRMEYTFNDKISALFDANSYHDDQYQKLEKRIRQNEIKIANLSLSSC